MTAADVLVIVIAAFFLVGVMVGIVVVYALSARKAHPADAPAQPDDSNPPDRGWPA